MLVSFFVKDTGILVFILSAAFFLLTRCANPVAPSGGPQDVQPPFMVKSEPVQYATNFKGNTIRITFNEFIKLTDINKSLMISPPFRSQPDIYLRKKSMVVKFNEELKEETTYNLFFGEAISDITENNKAGNFSFVFSTGSFVDSLSVKGTVLNAFDNKPSDKVFVLLYDISDDRTLTDTIPRKVRPVYLAKTNIEGKFILTNISSRKYLVFALRDLNANFLFDLPDEEIGFIDTLVSPEMQQVFRQAADTAEIAKTAKEAEPELLIRLFREQDSLQKLVRSRTAGLAHYNLIFKRPLSKPEMKFLFPEIKTDTIYTELSKSKDTLDIWLDQEYSDAASLWLTDGVEFADTIKFMSYFPPKEDKKAKTTARKEAYKTNLKGSKLPLNDTLRLRFDNPLLSVDTSKILLTGGMDTLHSFMAIVKNGISRDILIHHHWKEDISYELTLFPACIKGFKGFSNDTISLQFKKRPLTETGNLLVTVNRDSLTTGLILQVINKEGQVTREVQTEESRKVTFSGLEPGTWFLKAILDKNNNGKWDTGNYRAKLQPEQVIIFPKELNLRANWDIEETWTINP